MADFIGNITIITYVLTGLITSSALVWFYLNSRNLPEREKVVVRTSKNSLRERPNRSTFLH